MIYEIAIVCQFQKWEIEDRVFSFYALDFSFGFVSRILPGALYNMIFPELSYTYLVPYEITLLVLFFAVLSFFIEKILLSASQEQLPCFFVIVFLFLTGPATFAIYPQELGIQEGYWLYFAVIFFLFLSKKPLWLFIIPLCAATIFLHYSTILCYIPFFCVMILYKLSGATEKREKILLRITFWGSVIVSVVCFLYFTTTLTSNLVYSLEEFESELRKRGADNLYLCNTTFYGSTGTEIRQTDEFINAAYEAVPSFVKNLNVPDSVIDILSAAYVYIRLSLEDFAQRNPFYIIMPYAAIFPVVVVIFRFCFKELRNKLNSRLRRFVFLCIPSEFIFTLVASFFFSQDYVKWLAFGFVPLFGSFLFVMYKERDNVFSFLKSLFPPLTKSIVLAYCAVYCLVVLHPYV